MLHRSTFRHSKLIAGVLLVGLMLVTTPRRARAEESPWAAFAVGSQVAVTTPSGQLIGGAIDARTTATQLWLMATVEEMTVGSCLVAADVASIVAAEAVTLPPSGRGSVTSGLATTAPPCQERFPAATRPEVKSLAVMAELENWDNDAEPDGLRLYVVPRGPQGELVPAGGTLSIDLTVYRGNWVHSRGRYTQEEQWSSEIAARDFGPQGAVIDLPFRHLTPETDRQLHCTGKLHVRMNVAGVGAFDAVVPEVLLSTRPIHPLN